MKINIPILIIHIASALVLIIIYASMIIGYAFYFNPSLTIGGTHIDPVRDFFSLSPIPMPFYFIFIILGYGLYVITTWVVSFNFAIRELV
jgi:hypothetical protein